jgi:serine phosphatase RsbU (regulator of sigma subunit)
MARNPIPVLLVEDSPGDARLIREMLADADPSGFVLTRTERLEEGLRLLHEGRFGVVLLDLSLPDSQGLDTFRTLHAQTRHTSCHVPVVVLTSLGIEAMGADAVQEGAQDYLVKGQVGSAQLAHALRYAIGRHQRQQAVEGALLAGQEEMRIARQIQQHLFPGQAPVRPGFDIHGASFCAAATGGDYFDYLPLRDDRLGLVIADVTGHGVGPALLMASTRAYLRAFSQTQTDLGQILALTNRVLGPDLTDGRNVTLLLAELDCRQRTLLYTSAGHSTGYVFDRDGQVRERLFSTDVPLGILPDSDFPTAPAIALAEGDLVLLVTDGVAEARGPHGEPFGNERTLELVRAQQGRGARAIVEALYTAVSAFTDGVAQTDDITALVVKVSGEAA